MKNQFSKVEEQQAGCNQQLVTGLQKRLRSGPFCAVGRARPSLSVHGKTETLQFSIFPMLAILRAEKCM
jgi:hypothetical protein